MACSALCSATSALPGQLRQQRASGPRPLALAAQCRLPAAARPALRPQQAAALLPPPPARRRRTARLAATSSSTDGAPSEPSQPEQQQQPSGPSGEGLPGSLALWALWAGLAAYAFLLAPNQTPLRDSYFLEKLVGLGENDGVTINVVVQQLFLIMGVWPLVYTALLVPSGKSGNGVPAWPFITLSYAFGAFGLLPFMALWQPPKEPPQVPAPASALEGPGNLMQKGMESPVVAFLCLAGAVACLGQAALAGADQWKAYLKLLEESRFIHVMTLDFLTLTALAPFWMDLDASRRRWEGRDGPLLTVLSMLPVVGPAIYLCLRPRAKL